VLSGFSAKSVSLLCYVPVIGCVVSLLVLAASQFHNDRATRFHAFQGFYLSVTWLMAHVVLRPALLGGTVKLVALGAMIFMIVKLAQNQTFKLPLLGDLAEKSVAEQR
jgi:uncharacterized membrane protein